MPHIGSGRQGGARNAIPVRTRSLSVLRRPKRRSKLWLVVIKRIRIWSSIGARHHTLPAWREKTNARATRVVMRVANVSTWSRLMASDYKAIRDDNQRRYGTDIGRIGPLLLSDRYADRTHFIFEILQNAEDALRRRRDWAGSRAVSFHLTEGTLRIEHFGMPFDEADVRGICGIAQSTKDLTSIGRFGIGFKSVYAMTDRPEIHSGAEAFAIENYVWPVAVPPIARRDPDATVILIPLKMSDKGDHQEVARGLDRLDPSALLFLRQIEEIRWTVEGGSTGIYLRKSVEVGEGVRQVTLSGQKQGTPDIAETWLIFSRAVSTADGRHAGYVELAFLLKEAPRSRRQRIARVETSPLVVFFPTVVETHLGFLVQGPYQTTPSRDNVPLAEPWNQYLARETATLLRQALPWLRESGLLDTAALQCLPLDPHKFAKSSMFAPLYEATREALLTEALLPRYDVGHIPGAAARLGRTQELRDLLTPVQLGRLYGPQGELVWLSGEITDDRTPELRKYLIDELGVAEITPEAILARLNKPFLEAQPDEWIARLYTFLNRQPGLRERFEPLPLVRLENGTHVPARHNGQIQAFLPGTVATGFPTVRASVCTTDTARQFLRSLGLTEPDLVDDVVRNVLPKYRDKVGVSDLEYEDDIRRILTAFGTDSEAQRGKLVAALRDTAFVMAIDAGDGSKRASRPGEVYLPSKRLKELFAGVKGVLFIDDTRACLRGEEVRKLLETCGASPSLQPVTMIIHYPSWETSEKLREIRRHAGLERATWEGPVKDVRLRGLEEILRLLPQLDPETRRHKAALLWDALADVARRSGSWVFSASYTWGYSHETKRAEFDAAFVRHLNETAWIPDERGDLQRPEFVLFASLGWTEHQFLLTKIRFKPPVIETLAREAGIEPDVLDELKKYGITSAAELRARLGPRNVSGSNDRAAASESESRTAEPKHGVPGTTSYARTADGLKAEVPGDWGSEVTTATGAGGNGVDGRGESDGIGNRDRRTEPGAEPVRKEGRRTSGGKPFISYVGVHPDDLEPDSEGPDQESRMALEAKAIEFILSREPGWRRTPTHHPGYDLYLADESNNAIQWCEVKAMTASLNDHPVGLSHTQFDWAREHGEAYWLYVVEHAGTDAARIVRIRNPVGKARTFTFDHGWINVAELDETST